MNQETLLTAAGKLLNSMKIKFTSDARAPRLPSPVDTSGSSICTHAQSDWGRVPQCTSLLRAQGHYHALFTFWSSDSEPWPCTESSGRFLKSQCSAHTLVQKKIRICGAESHSWDHSFMSQWKWKLAAQSCLTLWVPMDCSTSGSSVHEIS